MKKKITILALCAVFSAFNFPVEAQQPAKVPRIGYLSAVDPASDSTRSEEFVAAMWMSNHEQTNAFLISDDFSSLPTDEGANRRFAGAAGNRVQFVINLKAAKQIGRTIPPNVLVRANQVIK